MAGVDAMLCYLLLCCVVPLSMIQGMFYSNNRMHIFAYRSLCRITRCYPLWLHQARCGLLGWGETSTLTLHHPQGSQGAPHHALQK